MSPYMAFCCCRYVPPSCWISVKMKKKKSCVHFFSIKIVKNGNLSGRRMFYRRWLNIRTEECGQVGVGVWDEEGLTSFQLDGNQTNSRTGMQRCDNSRPYLLWVKRRVFTCSLNNVSMVSLWGPWSTRFSW